MFALCHQRVIACAHRHCFAWQFAELSAWVGDTSGRECQSLHVKRGRLFLRADSRNVVGPYLGQVGNGTLAPLLGANGDGFRSVSALVGPNLLGNVFSGLGGDGISISGAPPRSHASHCRCCRTRGQLLCVSSFKQAARCLVCGMTPPTTSRKHSMYAAQISSSWPYDMDVTQKQSRPCAQSMSHSQATWGEIMHMTRGCCFRAGTYSVIAAIDAASQKVTVAVPCAACVGGLSPGAEVSSHI